MPAVDLSQLPEPAIIAEPDFEAILADTKAMMIASYPAEQREAVSAALELESEPLNVIAQTMSFREMLLRQRVNEGARACMLIRTYSGRGGTSDHYFDVATQRLKTAIEP